MSAHGTVFGPDIVVVGPQLWRESAGLDAATVVLPAQRCLPQPAGVLAHPAPAADRAGVAPIRRLDRVTLGLAMVNWTVLMLMLCAFLLAKTMSVAP